MLGDLPEEEGSVISRSASCDEVTKVLAGARPVHEKISPPQLDKVILRQ